MLYTVYCREAGRVGHHKSYNIRIEDITDKEIGLTYEVRNLREHQLYEFWVSEYIHPFAIMPVHFRFTRCNTEWFPFNILFIQTINKRKHVAQNASNR